MVVTEARKVGEILGQDVFKVVATDVIPLGRKPLKTQQDQDERVFVQMLRDITSNGAFHFSHSFDLTRSQQAQSGAQDLPLHKRVCRALVAPHPTSCVHSVLISSAPVRRQKNADCRWTSASSGTSTFWSPSLKRATARPVPG